MYGPRFELHALVNCRARLREKRKPEAKSKTVDLFCCIVLHGQNNSSATFTLVGWIDRALCDRVASRVCCVRPYFNCFVALGIVVKSRTRGHGRFFTMATKEKVATTGCCIIVYSQEVEQSLLIKVASTVN